MAKPARAKPSERPAETAFRKPGVALAGKRQAVLLVALLVLLAGLVWWANQSNRPPVVTISTPTPGASASVSATPGPNGTVLDLSSYPRASVGELDVWRVTFNLRDQNEGPANFEWHQSKGGKTTPAENQTLLVNGSVTRFTFTRYDNNSVATTVFERVESKDAVTGVVTVTGKRQSCTSTPPFEDACGDSYAPEFADLAKRQADTIRKLFFGFNTTRAEEDAALAKIRPNAGAIWTGTKEVNGVSCERYVLSDGLDDCFDKHGWLVWLRGPELDTRVKLLP